MYIFFNKLSNKNTYIFVKICETLFIKMFPLNPGCFLTVMNSNVTSKWSSTSFWWVSATRESNYQPVCQEAVKCDTPPVNWWFGLQV